MLVQAPCIGFLMDFPSRSALEDGSELRQVNVDGDQRELISRQG